ncbi:carbohydrate ABC transporter permease [Ktedonobacter racemifer]|uniref:Binding-protein-dependent transport systems inner membrane component n=1 Tax=Ktedonobacter racemifer DSM 44963 TaxID=485913 RepID=D6TR03_KTERA|nr:carbohydrate ABC transporter permease [Ktedonobacter racemifer]EFH85874.1 binding-protein-dependent transport systems inner membrane component [Ktedonobacter racemifer DSM 44963]
MDVSLQRNTGMRRRVKPQHIAGLSIRYLICVVVAIFMLIPILTAFLGAFKTTAELSTTPFSLPAVWHWENLTSVLSQGVFWQSLANSLIVTISTVVLLLVVACPAAFVFSRMPFRGREIIFNILLIGLLLPFAMAILPLYVTLRNLQLLNTLWAVILPQVAFALPTTILILRNFFQAIPGELEDATYIDGGTHIDFFWRILLPLARPSLAVIVMLNVVASWNNFFLPLIVLNDSKLWTVPLGVMQFQGEHSTDWAAVMAYISLMMIPALIFYLFAERHLIAGLTAGAVKG